MCTWPTGVTLHLGAATCKTHYIHHLNPRVNRALYYTWWDRVAGTFAGTHPRVVERSAEQQWEYEMRAGRMLWKQVQAWLLPGVASGKAE